MDRIAQDKNGPPKGVLNKIESTPQKNELTSVDGFSACPRCDGLHLWRDRFGAIHCSGCLPPPHRALVAERLIATLEGPEPLAAKSLPAGRPQRPVAEACVLRAGETLGEWWARLEARGAGASYVAKFEPVRITAVEATEKPQQNHSKTTAKQRKSDQAKPPQPTLF
jgi:hypothetical protein